MKLQITEYGKKRVASDDFAKCLVHVIQLASDKKHDLGDAFTGVATYVAMNLAIGKNNVVELPSGDEGAVLSAFMEENDAVIRETIHCVMASTTFLSHMLETFGMEGVAQA